MKHFLLAALAATLVTGCRMREMPQDYTAVLDSKDKKFNSAACKEMREKAQSYDFNFAGPAAVILIAAPVGGLMMINEDQKRYRFLNELHDACSSKPRPGSWDWPDHKKP